MINHNKDKITGVYTEGFDAVREGRNLIFGSGKIVFTHGVENEVFNFESFGFEITGDDEFDTVYTVYLCEDRSVEVTRHEMMPDTIPMYSGDKDLLHILSDITIKPNGEEFITVRLLEEKVVETTSEEV